MTQQDQALVRADDLAVGYGNTPVLSEVCWSIGPNSELALTGRSGSGKTTLLLVLAGLLKPLSGQVSWPALAPNRRLRTAEIGLVFQAPSLLPELTAMENIALPLRLRGTDNEPALRAAQDAIVAVDLKDAAHALPYQLSGGQQQRVAVARVIAGRPRLVLADEPTGALDRANAATVLTVLRDRVRETGGALIVATHDRELAALLGRQAHVHEGRLQTAEAAESRR